VAARRTLALAMFEPTMRRPRLLTIAWAWREGTYAIAAFLLVAGVGSVLALHLLRPDVDPANHYISEYGNETWGCLLSVALVLIGSGLLALGAALRATVRTRTGPRLMQASGAMLLVAAVFSTDRLDGEVEASTLAGEIHAVMAIGAFCLLVLAMATLSARVVGDGNPLGGPSALALPLALAAPAVAAAAFALVPDAHGLRQRLFLAIVFGWLLATAFQVRSLRRSRAEIELARRDSA
jgi:hypothetical protein